MALSRPNVNLKNYSLQVGGFGGIDYRDSIKNGELSACENMSTEYYPALMPRLGRTKVEDYDNVSDIFEWDGRLAVVANGLLYWNGEALTDITPGIKQWAVVNTKIVIFPDKLYIDISDPDNPTFGTLGQRVTAYCPAIEDDEITLTMNTSTTIAEDVRAEFFDSKHPFDHNPAFYSYGTDTAAVEAQWDAANGQWRSTLSNLAELRGVFNSNGFDTGTHPISIGATNAGGVIEDVTSRGEGLIFIPSKSKNAYSLVIGLLQEGTLPDTSKYNTDGCYGVLTRVTGKPKLNSSNEYEDHIISEDRISVFWHCDIYRVGQQSLVDSFDVGMYTDIRGTDYGLCDVTMAQISTINTDSITFESGSLKVPLYVCHRTFATPATTCKLIHESDGYWVTFPKVLPRGCTLVMYDTSEVKVWDGEKFIATYPLSTTGPSVGFVYGLETYTVTGKVTVGRSIPEFDFICEANNRLWGVVNNKLNTIYDAETESWVNVKARVIYASALGDPTDFTTYAGISTDAYAVAVGSEGDFTGICFFSDSVWCWKEDCVHKVFGDYPAEITLARYKYPGVKKGCDRSLVVINEVLYYLSPDGVYATSGGAPQMVGYKLGDNYTDAVGGTDGALYHISMSDGSPSEYVYDPVHGIWTRTDGSCFKAYSLAGNVLYALDDVGVIRVLDDKESDETVSWWADIPALETNYETTLYRKIYRFIRLRLEPEEGSTLTISVSFDGGEFKTLESYDTVPQRVNTAIPVNRCDKLTVRLSGTGRVKVKSMELTFKLVRGTE